MAEAVMMGTGASSAHGEFTVSSITPAISMPIVHNLGSRNIIFLLCSSDFRAISGAEYGNRIVLCVHFGNLSYVYRQDDTGSANLYMNPINITTDENVLTIGARNFVPGETYSWAVVKND